MYITVLLFACCVSLGELPNLSMLTILHVKRITLTVIRPHDLYSQIKWKSVYEVVGIVAAQVKFRLLYFIVFLIKYSFKKNPWD